MLKQSETVKRLPSSRRVGASVRTVARLTTGALLGLLSAYATVYGGISPFGVGAAAAVSGVGAPLVYLAVAVGYLLRGRSGGDLLQTLSAVALVGGLRWVLGGLGTVGKSRWFPPLAAFLSVAVTGTAVRAVGGFSWEIVLLTLCESLLAGGYACFFRLTADRLLEPCSAANGQAARLSLTVVGAVVLMSVAGLEIAGISVGRILAATLVLLFARTGRESGGAIAGTVIGVAMMLATGDSTVAASLALGGLLAGWLLRYGRAASAAVFFAVGVISSVGQTDVTALLIGLYETLTACILFLAIPHRLDTSLSQWFGGTEERPEAAGVRRSVVRRLQTAGEALQDVADTVDTVSGKLAAISEPDIGTLFTSLADSVCRTCGLRMTCWQTEQRRTVDCLHQLVPHLRDGGAVTRRDLPPEFRSRCARPDLLTAEITRRYGDFCIRESAFRRIGEIRSAVTDQFLSMAELLGELSDRFQETAQVDTATAERVESVCRDQGLTPSDLLCLRDSDGRLSLEITTTRLPPRLDREEWAESVASACGCRLTHPVFRRLPDGITITFEEYPRFRARLEMAQLCCDGEKLCGDAACWSQQNGILTAVLSDGMGSGGRAAVDGALAAHLASRLLKAGFGEDTVLRLVNTALMTKSEDESLSTLDVVRVDCYTGHLDLLKAGATFTYLLSQNRLSRFDRASLPAGILPDIRFDKQRDTLTEGDLLVMISDGVLTDDSSWLEEKILAYPDFPHSLKAFCEDIALTARQHQNAHQDDITVLAITLDRPA